MAYPYGVKAAQAAKLAVFGLSVNFSGNDLKIAGAGKCLRIYAKL